MLEMLLFGFLTGVLDAWNQKVELILMVIFASVLLLFVFLNPQARNPEIDLLSLELLGGLILFILGNISGRIMFNQAYGDEGGK